MIAFGELGLHPWEFALYDMEAFTLKVEGHRKAKIESWHQTRALAYIYAKPYLPKGVTIERWWPMEGDRRISNLKSNEEKLKRFHQLRKWYVDKGFLNSN